MGKPNVILIVCDSLRKDILEIYGGPAKTPNLKRLAKEAMVYENAIAPSPWTFPSHVSLFTGLYPSRHGVHESEHEKLQGLAPRNKELKAERLPEYLKGIGYRTIGISNNIMVSRFTNFDLGFNQFFNMDTDPWTSDPKMIEAKLLGGNRTQVIGMLLKKRGIGASLGYLKPYLYSELVHNLTNYPIDKGINSTNRFISKSRLSPRFFLFINLMEPHEPYKGHDGKDILDQFTNIREMEKEKVAKLKKQYIKGVEYLDKNLGDLIKMLEDGGFWENTLLVITSDHGQAFNENGYMYHGNYLYDEIIRVPLVIKYPNGMKFPERRGYQSLTSIFNLVKSIIKDGDDKILTTNLAFAESFGLEKILPESHKWREDYVKATYEKTRKAVYENNSKLTLNSSEGVIEEFLNDGKNASPGAYKKGQKRLIMHIKNLEGR